MKVKTQIYETWLPKFSGFYESIFSFNDNDLEWALFDNPHSVDAEISAFIADKIIDFIDYQQYEIDASKAITGSIGSLIREQVPSVKSIKYESLSSPEYYNFSTDSINIKIDVDLIALLESIDKTDFAKYVENNYTSCSGFISYYTNDVDKWLLTFRDDLDHKIGAVLDFLTEIDPMDVYEDFCENIYGNDYIDYGGLVKAVNEKFDLTIKNLSELEQ